MKTCGGISLISLRPLPNSDMIVVHMLLLLMISNSYVD